MPGINAVPNKDNLYLWNAVIFGPDETPYEDGTFHLTMEFPDNYPLAPPKVTFISPMFHPNVYSNGSICLDILSTTWSPTLNATAILLSVQALLSSPNPNSPANAEAAMLYTVNRPEYDRRVRQTVEASWMQTSLEKCSQEPTNEAPKRSTV